MTASSNVPDSDSLTTPLVTLQVHEILIGAARAGVASVECSLDLMKTRTTVEIDAEGWRWGGQRYPYLETCKERTIYFWDRSSFAPIARYSTSLIKLVPTQWGPPTFEIDGIKMLPTAHVSPFDDAQRKVGLIQPRGKRILDTCAGLGYFASWCLEGSAAHVLSFEKNPDVIWLRSLNPWSPRIDPSRGDARFDFKLGDVVENIGSLASDAFDAVLHDPPRFGIAGELYSQTFYDQLARVLRRKGRLFHYTGTPNKLTSGRDVPAEVANRLRRAGFTTRMEGDGVLATKGGR